ncbi:sugar transferase [Polaromonas eurypsychrophila]|uniref:Glycosyl transferase n=1 Tax=Polaromonas eurypsychrophila TaxID=1614635 RepID=A0A916SFD5_9BURK|nr:sugar transferase [Polaromonas eurypsychrophila]GGA94577.1 glycosyl transferase [Polaromonas eurypsychrophila]
MIYRVAKRLTDLGLSSAAVLVLAPAMLLIALLIKAGSPGPVFYRGERAGKNGRVFRILKFRSMVVDAERKGGFSTAIDDPRLTGTGRFIRKYKLDELPQFFNVLVGDMSLVGPRPQVLFYTNKYTGEERSILSVKPGITDLASLYFADMDSVLGSGDVDARYLAEVEPVKNKLRLRYIREQSYLLDMRILVETAFKLIGFENVTGLNVSPGKSKANG